MKNTVICLFAIAGLFSCVKIPETPASINKAPSITLQSEQSSTYPGTRVRIESSVSDPESDQDSLQVTWSVETGDAIVEESSLDHAVLVIDINASPEEQVTVKAKVSDPEGAESDETAIVSIVPEPSFLIDAQTNLPNLAEQDPIYIVGAYSSKRRNIKADDALASSNHLVDLSPDGQYLFYIQLFSTANWQANLYDFSTNTTHVVDMDFNNRDVNALESFWSNDSRYIAVKAPHVSDANQDRLYWLSTADMTQGAVATTREISSFDSFIWSDNNPDADQQAYAVLISEEEIKLFDPSSANQRVITLKDNTLASPQTFTYFNEHSPAWASNQLFFTASVTFTSDPDAVPYKTVLYQWRSDNAKVVQLTDAGGAQEVSEFAAHSASAIAMIADDEMWYYDGATVSEVNLSNVSLMKPENTEFRWSPDGRLLAVVIDPENPSTVGNWTFITWNDKGHEFLHADWAESGEPDVTTWAWDDTQSSVSVLSVDDTAGLSKLFRASTTANASMATKVDPIHHIDTEQFGYDQRTELQRSPNGKWQLFWAADLDNASRHLDIWAHNTETDTTVNVSRLKDNYLSPVTEAEFEEVAGYGLSESGLARVTESVVWLSEDELVFSVTAIEGSEDIIDVRMMNLEEDSMAHSLLVRPEEFTKIVSVLQ